MRFAAIDQSTTSTRALILEENGQCRVIYKVEHKQLYPQNGWVEHDPEQIISIIEQCVAAIGQVDAIGMDNQGESCLAWDSISKQALSPIIVWQDNRTKDTIHTLKAHGHEATVLVKSGLMLDPYFSASKLGWLMQNNSAVAKAHKKGTLRLGTTDAFFLDRLTGYFVTDASTASRTSLMNLKTLCWDPFLCDLFGVPIETLPEIVTTTGDFGALKTTNGFVPVTASIVDQQAALYGFGCRQTGDTKITFGTGAFALMLTGDKIHSKPEQGILPTIAWHLADQPAVYALDGGVYTASGALNWAKSLGLFNDFSQICSFNNPTVISRGLVFVPALSGLGCPHWDSSARGNWLGLSLEHDAKDMVQAILEGVAFRTGQVIEAFRSCAPLPNTIPIDGGMSGNEYYTQFLSNVLQINIQPASFSELTGLGTAMLAAKAMGHDIPITTNFQNIAPKNDLTRQKQIFADACQISKNWKPLQQQ